MVEFETWREYFKYKGVRELLDPYLNKNEISWGQYTRNSEKALSSLVESNDLVIAPNDDLSLIQAIENLQDQVLIIPESYDIIPEGYGALRFIKRGNEVSIPRLNSREAAIYSKRSLQDLVNGALDNKVKINDEYSGFSHKGFRIKNRVKKTRLIDCVKGSELFVLAENNNKLESKVYYGKDPELSGARCSVKVPSRSEDKYYEFVIDSIPVTRKFKGGNDFYANSFDITTQHDCPAKHWNGLHYRRMAGEDYTCPHEIAGYFKICKDINESDSKYIVNVNPYLIPTDEMLEFSKKLRNNVLKEVRVNGEVRRVRLNEVMLEILLWKKVAKDGVVKTFRNKRATSWFHDVF